MKIIRNICKNCNGQNFIDKDFNYKLNLCNNCLEKSLTAISNYEFKGLFKVDGFPYIVGNIVAISPDNKYFATKKDLYDITELKQVYSFPFEISCGIFSADGKSFFGFFERKGFQLKLIDNSWKKSNDLIIQQNNVIEITRVNGEIYLLIGKKDAIHQANIVMLNQNDLSYKMLPKVTFDVWFSFYGRIGSDFNRKILSKIGKSSKLKVLSSFEELIENDEKFFHPLLNFDYIDIFLNSSHRDAISIIDKHRLWNKIFKKNFTDIKNNIKIELPCHSTYYESIGVFSNKLDLLIYTDYVYDREHFDKCLRIYSIKYRNIVTQLFFDTSIYSIGLRYNDSYLIVRTKDNISYIHSTQNWSRIAELYFNNENEYAYNNYILKDKTILVESNNGYIYKCSNVL